MKKYIVTLLAFIFSFLHAQKHELGVFIGGANGITDIGQSKYIDPLPKKGNNGLSIPLVLAALYRYNLNPQQSLRFQVSLANIGENDRTSSQDYRYNREASYGNNLIETSLVFEYNFFNINSEQKRAHSPYIFGGLAVFGHNINKYDVYYQFKRNTNGNIESTATDFDYSIETKKEMVFDFSIPFGVGYKYKFNWNFIISAEIGVRATLIDNLDLASTEKSHFTFYTEEGLLDLNNTPHFTEKQINKKNREIIKSKNIGNNSSNDWYVFSGLSLTYAFGRPPCFCD